MGKLHKLRRRFRREKFNYIPYAVKIHRRQIGESEYTWISSPWSWYGQPHKKFLDALKRAAPP